VTDTDVVIILAVLMWLLVICGLFFVFEKQFNRLYIRMSNRRFERRTGIRMPEAKAMREHRIMAGERIENAIRELVALANKHMEPIKADFNGVEIIANPGDNPAVLRAKWNSDTDRMAEEYRNSPEAKRAERERARKKRETDRRIASVIDLLDEVDFSDLDSVVDWLYALTEYDTEGAAFDRQSIIDRFQSNGFELNVYCDNEFAENDREIYARWMIGQILEIYFNRPHLFRKFADEWREKFSSAGATC
jgi:hypothetical protein